MPGRVPESGCLGRLLVEVNRSGLRPGRCSCPSSTYNFTPVRAVCKWSWPRVRNAGIGAACRVAMELCFYSVLRIANFVNWSAIRNSTILRVNPSRLLVAEFPFPGSGWPSERSASGGATAAIRMPDSGVRFQAALYVSSGDEPEQRRLLAVPRS